MNRNKILPAKESANYSPSAFREVLRQLRVAVSFTKGVSMRPLIWTGCHYVGVVPLSSEPEIGDILLFEQVRGSETACILHRLVEISEIEGQEKIYITRGDNCLDIERVSREKIIGKVAVIYRACGWRPWFALASKEIRMDDERYLRYVSHWNRIWPLRRRFYQLRAWYYTNPLSRSVLRPIYRFFFRRGGRA